MQIEQLKSLIESAVRDGLSYQWVMLVLAIIAAAVGSYVGAYLGKKGEAKAAREGFSTLLHQARETTRETEAIKQLLSGKAWRSQRQWEFKERYYGELLSHLHAFRLALSELSDYYIEPGSEHTPDSQQGEHFITLKSQAWEAYRSIKELVGNAVLFLSPKTVEAIDNLVREHWDLANIGAICTADYVDSAYKLACIAHEAVVAEASLDLGLGANDA